MYHTRKQVENTVNALLLFLVNPLSFLCTIPGSKHSATWSPTNSFFLLPLSSLCEYASASKKTGVPNYSLQTKQQSNSILASSEVKKFPCTISWLKSGNPGHPWTPSLGWIKADAKEPCWGEEGKKSKESVRRMRAASWALKVILTRAGSSTTDSRLFNLINFAFKIVFNDKF